MLDHMAHDGLFCAFDQVAMGASTEKYNYRYELTRAEQDEFSARSHQRGRRGREERASSPRRSRRCRSRSARATRSTFAADEGIRGDTTAESLGKLRPAFSSDGTITAGSASQISDGAAAVVVMSKAKAEELGLTWLAEIGAHGVVAGPDASLHEQPANAIAAACAKEGIDAGRPRPRRDQRGVRRRRASCPRASSGIDEDKVNVNGGAIALGHPIGMSGARIALHLALELKRRGGGVGAAALCGGGGQGDALIIRVPAAS